MRLARGSLLESSPGLGMAGSFRLRFMATCERRRSLGIRPSLGEPRLLKDDLRDSLAALILAAEAREMEVLRGEGVSCRLGGEVIVCIDLGCMGEEDMDLDGGKELRSGGAMATLEFSAGELSICKSVSDEM